MLYVGVSVANENVSLVISRQILTEFCSYFCSLPDVVGKDVAHFTLDKVQPRVVSFEEQVVIALRSHHIISDTLDRPLTAELEDIYYR